jgi:hypothetical protein
VPGRGTFHHSWCSSIRTTVKFIPLWPPLIPPVVSRRLRERLLLAPEWGDPVVRTLFPLLQVIIPVMTLRPHSLRLKVAIVQQEFHFLRASPLWVHSRRRLHAPTHAQPRQNKQALQADHLYKCYPLGGMFGIHFCILPRASVQSIGLASHVSGLSKVSKNRSGAAKPR